MKNIEYMFQFLIKVMLYIITFVLSWGMHIQDNNTGPVFPVLHTTAYH